MTAILGRMLFMKEVNSMITELCLCILF